MNRTLPDRIFVCGFMGAGKSTVGKALASKAGLPFHDLDDCIEQQAGQTIPAIFESEGEQGFRQKEQAALLDVIRNAKGVIALGGGTLQSQYLVDQIKVNGLLVFIDTSMEQIVERIRGDEHRPLLADENGEMKSELVLKEDLTALFKERQPFYEQAEVTVNTGESSNIDDLAAQLLKKIQYHVALH